NADAGTVTTTSFQVEDDHINIKLTQHPSLAEESKQADDELSKAEKHLDDAEDDDARKVAEKEVEAANQHKIDVDGSKEHAKEGAGREVENAQKDAENAWNEVDVAEHHKSEAEGRKSEAEHHKSEAEGRKSEAEHHKSEAESRKSEANKELANAEKHLHEAKTRTEKNDAQSEVGKAKQDQIKADADISKAQKDVDNARHEVERAQQDADNAQKDSDKARKEIDVAEQHKTEAEGRKAEAEHAIGETVNDQVTATIHVDLGPNIDASLYVKVDVFDGSVEGNPSVKTAYIALTDLNKSGDGDYTFSYNTQVEGHSYTVSIADKLYTHQGETYRQQDSTDDLAISRVIEIAAHDVLVVNDEALPALNGLDIITNYHAGDLIDFAGIPSVAMHDDGVYNTHLKIDGSTYIDIQSHAIVNGVVTFYSGENQTSLLSLNSDAKIASALDYLTHHDIGNQGAAVVFEDASNNSYVYSQTTSNNGAADSYSFVKLEGFNAFNGVSSSPTNVDVHTVHIE
ncbi:MAG: hypothetical protein NTW57_07030, partial [Methylophilales bacterium]|nr:hypothetical protein [Methylophilales bacterium]